MPDYKTKANALIEGVISKAYRCEDNKPFKLIIETDDGDVSVHAWPNKAGERAGELPKAVAKLNTQTDILIGHSVKAYVRQLPDKGYGVQYELRDNSDMDTGYKFQLIRNEVEQEEDTTSRAWGVLYPDDAKPATTAPKMQPPSPPAGMTRTEYGMAKGNAISAMTALIASHVSKTGKLPSLEFIEEGAGLINSGSEAILSGRIAETEETPDETQEPDDDGESFGAIQVAGK